MKTISITFDDEQEKAMLWDIADLEVWVNNAFFNKERQCKDAICQLALEDQKHIILSIADKQLFSSQLATEGIIITTVKHLPEAMKREIVKRANIKSAAQRNKEFEAEAAMTVPEGMGEAGAVKPKSLGMTETVKGFVNKLLDRINK